MCSVGLTPGGGGSHDNSELQQLHSMLQKESPSSSDFDGFMASLVVEDTGAHDLFMQDMAV